MSVHTMILTILGCGTSTGVPLIQCQCSVCQSNHPKNTRLRASAWVQVRGKSFLIDTSTDLRQQALKAAIPRVDAVLFTHPHADHVHGIDELRSFNFVQKETIPAYGNAWTVEELTVKFSYIFNPPKLQEGGGIPQLSLHQFDASSPFLEIEGEKIVPLAVSHGSKETVGYRFGDLAYVTDCNSIPAQTLDRMRGLEILVLDCLRLRPHGTHFNLQQALETVEDLKPRQTYLTHLGHEFDYTEWVRKLPKGVSLAYDGLRLESPS